MHKIFSYLLLCVGLLIILFALGQMYKVFIGGETVRALVAFGDLTIQTQVGPMQVPMQAANTIANLGVFALFMFFVMAVGGKVATIGVQLLKNERIYDALLQIKPSDINTDTLKKLWKSVSF